MSNTAYKLLHLFGIFLLFGGLGSLWMLSASRSGDRAASMRRLVVATHGVALVLILVAGFGMMARLGIMTAWPAWIWIKLAIWLLIGGLPVLLRRAESAPGPLFFLAPLLGLIAAYAALFHLGGVQ